VLARYLTWAFLFLLTGCGLQTIGIKHIDTLLMMQASRKMDLHSKQKDVLAADIAAFLNAQKGHVPTLDALLREVDLARPEKFEGQWQRAIVEYRRAARETAVVIARQLAHLSAEQRAYFNKNLIEENNKLEDKGLNRDQVEERVEWFLGELRPPQQTAINTHLPVLQARRVVRLGLRRKLQARLAELMNGQAVDREQLMVRAFVDYQEAGTADQGPVLAFYADLVRQIDGKQKRRFEERRGELLELLKTFVATNY